MRLLVFILILTIYSFKISNNYSPKAENIFIEILNKDTITNGEIIEVKITNESRKNYCFLIDTLAYKYKYITPLESGIINNHIYYLYNNNNEEISYNLKDQLCYSNESLINYYKDIKFKKSVNTLIKVKANSSIKCKLKFNSIFFINEYCRGNYDFKNKKNLFFGININYNKYLLTKQMLDSVEKMGYKMYKKTLKSNRVPFKFKD